MDEFEGPDFELTYPNYILLQDEGEGAEPLVILQDDEPCICLFTDLDLLTEFHARNVRAKTGEASGNTRLNAATCADRLTLLTVLEELLPMLAASGVHRIALDASNGKRILSAHCLEFIEMLRLPDGGVTSPILGQFHVGCSDIR